MASGRYMSHSLGPTNLTFYDGSPWPVQMDARLDARPFTFAGEAQLLTTDGKKVPSIQAPALADDHCGVRDVSDFDLVFPRYVDGVPVIKPGTKKVTIEFVYSQESGFNFRINKMMYKGNLDY